MIIPIPHTKHPRAPQLPPGHAYLNAFSLARWRSLNGHTSNSSPILKGGYMVKKEKYRISKLIPYKGKAWRAEVTFVNAKGIREGKGIYSDRQISSNGKALITFYSGEGVKAGAKINPARASLFEAEFEKVAKKDEE